MVANKEHLYRLVDQLDDQSEKTAYEFMLFLLTRQDPSAADVILLEPKKKKENSFWNEVESVEDFENELSEEEQRQLDDEEGYMSREDVRREYGV